MKGFNMVLKKKNLLFVLIIILTIFVNTSCIPIGFVSTYPNYKVNYKNGDSYGLYTAKYESTIYYLSDEKEKSFIFSMNTDGTNCQKLFEVKEIRSLCVNKNYIYFLGANDENNSKYDLFSYNKSTHNLECIRKNEQYFYNLFASEENIIIGGDWLLIKIDLNNNTEKILFNTDGNKSKLIENSQNKLNKNLENIYTYEDEKFIVFFDISSNYVIDYQVYQKNNNTLVMRGEINNSFNSFSPLIFDSNKVRYSYRSKLYKILDFNTIEKIGLDKYSNYQRISLIINKSNITKLLLQNYKQNFFSNETIVEINNDSEIVSEITNPTKGMTLLLKDSYSYILENGKISKYDYYNNRYFDKDIYDISKYLTKYVTIEICGDWLFIFKVKDFFSNDEIPIKLLFKINI